MPIPYIFSTATGTIGLNELDTNFAYVSNLVPALAQTAGTVTESNQPNIAAVGILNSLSVTGGVTAGSVTAGTLTGTLSVGPQLNITNIGTLGNLVVTGLITASNVNATYLQGTYVTAVNLGGTLTTAAQPGVTSLGTLDSLSVTGTVTASELTGSLTTAAQPNVTSVGDLVSLSVTGNVIAGNISTTNISSSNLTVTNISASQLSGTLTTAAQPNITSVGTLTLLSVSGNVTGGNLNTLGSISGANISGTNLTLTGNIQGNVGGYTIGYRDIPQLSWTVSESLPGTSSGKHYYSTSSTSTTMTIPANSGTPMDVGTAITVINNGTGTLTISPAVGVTLYLTGSGTTGSRSLARYGLATLIKTETDIWFISGTGIA